MSQESENYFQAQRVEQILAEVKAAMQAAEELGAPTGEWYQLLMHKIASEALRRAQVHREINEEVPVASSPEHVMQLANCLPIQEMAYDCISAGRQDEALLHVGMLGVYLGRLSAMPFMKLTGNDVARIEHALDYQFDMTDNQAEDELNKALLKRLQGERDE